MTADSPKKRENIFQPLEGDESGRFELRLAHDAVSSLESALASSNAGDDFVFQAHLRYLASIYFFLGGYDFSQKLSEEIGTTDASVLKWLDGQSAPAPSLRGRAISAAITLVRHIEALRRNGASLWDVTCQKPE